MWQNSNKHEKINAGQSVFLISSQSSVVFLFWSKFRLLLSQQIFTAISHIKTVDSHARRPAVNADETVLINGIQIFSLVEHSVGILYRIKRSNIISHVTKVQGVKEAVVYINCDLSWLPSFIKLILKKYLEIVHSRFLHYEL